MENKKGKIAAALPSKKNEEHINQGRQITS